MASAMGGRGSPGPDSAPPRAVREGPSAMARSDRRFETLTYTSPVPANPAQSNASETAGKSVASRYPLPGLADWVKINQDISRLRSTFQWDFPPYRTGFTAASGAFAELTSSRLIRERPRHDCCLSDVVARSTRAAAPEMAAPAGIRACERRRDQADNAARSRRHTRLFFQA